MRDISQQLADARRELSEAQARLGELQAAARDARDAVAAAGRDKAAAQQQHEVRTSQATVSRVEMHSHTASVAARYPPALTPPTHPKPTHRPQAAVQARLTAEGAFQEASSAQPLDLAREAGEGEAAGRLRQLVQDVLDSQASLLQLSLDWTSPLVWFLSLAWVFAGATLLSPSPLSTSLHTLLGVLAGAPGAQAGRPGARAQRGGSPGQPPHRAAGRAAGVRCASVWGVGGQQRAGSSPQLWPHLAPSWQAPICCLLRCLQGEADALADARTALDELAREKQGVGDDLAAALEEQAALAGKEAAMRQSLHGLEENLTIALGVAEQVGWFGAGGPEGITCRCAAARASAAWAARPCSRHPEPTLATPTPAAPALDALQNGTREQEARTRQELVEAWTKEGMPAEARGAAGVEGDVSGGASL